MFILNKNTPDEVVDGRQHTWLSKPGLTATEDLYFVRVVIPPGGGHPFHIHPNKEEILYIISGQAEQWLEHEKQLMKPGDSVHIPASSPHATYNDGEEDLVFLAVITPGSAEGEIIIDVSQEEPWRSLRA
ncbi:MAG: cupin domain-containing protein [Verrucomicrobiales bacterium]